MKNIESKIIHGDIINKDKRQDVYGALKTPVYNSVSFEFESAESISAAFQSKIIAHSYTRISNPTVAELESRLAYIAGAQTCLCLSSGMAAIVNTILAACDTGDNILSTKYLFGNTYSLLSETLASLGIHTKFIDMESPDEILANIDSKTRMIFLENITNPQLIVFDMEKIAEIAASKNVLLVVDNSILTPYAFKGADWGVDIEIISLTKYISGGATSVGGAILINNSDKWQYCPKLKEYYQSFKNAALIKKLLKEVYRNLGSCLSPDNAYMQLLGLETLALRIEKTCENAGKIGRWLKSHPCVKSVTYPALEDNKYNPLVKKYFGGKSGSLLCFELEDMDKCFRFINNLKMIRCATNFCDNKTLIIHPASTIFVEFDKEKRAWLQVTENMIRLSAGIEHVQDIIDDMNQALSKL